MVSVIFKVVATFGVTFALSDFIVFFYLGRNKLTDFKDFCILISENNYALVSSYHYHL